MSLNVPLIGEHSNFGRGIWAEVKIGGENLKLFSEHNALGAQASVYDVNAKKWIAPSEPVEDIEQEKEKATEYAKTHLNRANLELPPEYLFPSSSTTGINIRCRTAWRLTLKRAKVPYFRIYDLRWQYPA
jgi:hypothetical protein